MHPSDSTNRPAPVGGALQFVVLDTLAAILERADNVRHLGEYLTDTMREFSGARLTALVQFGTESDGAPDRVVSICPVRLEGAVDPAAIIRFARGHRGGTRGEVPALPQAAAYAPPDLQDFSGSSLVLPLLVGERRVGAVVLLGLPEAEPHASAVHQFLAPLTGVIGLVLRNTTLFEQQETVIQQRTMALVEDIAERERIEEALNWELRVNRAVADLSNQLITGTNDPQVVADEILHVACGLTEAEFGYVLEVDPVGGDALIYGMDSSPAARLAPQAPQDRLVKDAAGRYDGMLGYCLNTRLGFFTNAPATHPAGQAPPFRDRPFRQFLSVPIVFGGQLMGSIALANARNGFSERHLSGLGRFAKFYALAMQRRRVELERQALEQQLRHSQRLEAIGTLAGGIAHDFNNILTPILGEVGLAMDSLPDGTPLHFALSQIELAATRAKDLVKQILVFSRRQDVERRPVSLDRAIGEAARLLRASLPSTIAIETEIDAPDATVFANQGEIHQVLMNLGVNAGHAMREHGGTLRFGLEWTEPPPLDAPQAQADADGWACLSVSDTGTGMDATTKDRLFEPYFTTKAAGEGTGLGLAVVHGVVMRTGGHIDVSTVPGRGTTFRIWFPLVSAGQAPAEATAADRVNGHGERILIVDDEQAIVDVATQILQKFGYQVTSSISSVEALDVFRANPDGFDLVISDQTLPHMTGADLARAMLAIRPSVKIVLMTGYSESLDEQQAHELGAAAFLMKPFTMTDFADTARRALAS